MPEPAKPKSRGLLNLRDMILFWVVAMLVGYIAGLWGGCS